MQQIEWRLRNEKNHSSAQLIFKVGNLLLKHEERSGITKVPEAKKQILLFVILYITIVNGIIIRVKYNYPINFTIFREFNKNNPFSNISLFDRTKIQD